MPLPFSRGPRTFIFTFLLCIGFLKGTGPALAQTLPEPQREDLLNGLRILIWSNPGSSDLMIKLRIHSGSAFDLEGKSGEMALLGEIMFPDPAAREFFEEQANGRLDVETNYDSITVTMVGRANEFERIIEILRNALVATALTYENLARVRDQQLKLLKETAAAPAEVANRAIAARLFGDFPYGRPPVGSAEDIERIERPDLMLARERFLNPNNATLTITGGVTRNRAMRALRQLLGAWIRSEQIVPTTFRQPAPPDIRTLILNGPPDTPAEVRLATRGLARRDPDFSTANMLAVVVRQRWEGLAPELATKPHFVRHEAHVLPGMFVMGASVDSNSVASVLTAARRAMDSVLRAPVSLSELDQAKKEVLLSVNTAQGSPDGLTNAWLDINTYRLPSLSEQLSASKSVSAADLQRVAGRLVRDGGTASVVLGNAQKLKTELEQVIQIEVTGEFGKPTQHQPEPEPGEKPSTAANP